MNPLCGIPNSVGYLYLEYLKKNPGISGKDVWKIIQLKNSIRKILEESKIPEDK
jgi:hypothetical protein